MSLRILVTGSRTWRDRSAIARALTSVIDEFGGHLAVPDGVGGHPGPTWGQITVVHGAAFGADTLAARIAVSWGLRVEAHPVTNDDWHAPCGPTCRPGHRRIGRDERNYCPAVGNHRNQRMVDLGADMCLAFPLGRASGTRDCVRRAAAAGIPVRIIEPAPQAVTP